MKKVLMDLLIFAGGVVLGAASSYKFIEKKMEVHYEEEIRETKESFKAMLARDLSPENSKEHTPDENATVAKNKADVTEYAKIVKEAGYIDYGSNFKSKKNPCLYTIDPNDVGEMESEGYYVMEFTHYSDGVLTNENKEPIEDVEGYVGLDYADHLGEYEDDSVCIRNDKRKCDIQIIFDDRKYANVVKTLPSKIS